ncbi:hypothetical protein HK104_005637, partial [Borealophlyctis nickersoniae]
MEGKAYFGPEVDVYGLGATLYYMLRGDEPFACEWMRDLHTLQKYGKTMHTKPESVSCDAWRIIVNTLKYDPRLRATMSYLLTHR